MSGQQGASTLLDSLVSPEPQHAARSHPPHLSPPPQQTQTPNNRRPAARSSCGASRRARSSAASSTRRCRSCAASRARARCARARADGGWRRRLAAAAAASVLCRLGGPVGSRLGRSQRRPPHHRQPLPFTLVQLLTHSCAPTSPQTRAQDRWAAIMPRFLPPKPGSAVGVVRVVLFVYRCGARLPPPLPCPAFCFSLDRRAPGPALQGGHAACVLASSSPAHPCLSFTSLG